VWLGCCLFKLFIFIYWGDLDLVIFVALVKFVPAAAVVHGMLENKFGSEVVLFILLDLILLFCGEIFNYFFSFCL
jgi:hypothetical protein